MIDQTFNSGAEVADPAPEQAGACMRFAAGVLGFAVALCASGLAAAQDGSETPVPVEKIALELNNPVTSLRSFTIDYEGMTYTGDLPGSDDQRGSRLLFTTLWPIELQNGKNLQLRLTIPVNGDLPNWQPTFFIDYRDFTIRKVPEDEPRIDPANGGSFGYGHDHMGDISLDVGVGSTGDNGRFSMLGMSLVMPTSEDGSGSRNQWLLGPEFAYGKITDRGILGFRAKHLTDIAGEGEQELGRLPTNETTLQLLFARSLGNGWQIESNPIILYDWEAVSGNEWVVPIGAGFSKTFRWGRRPMKFAMELQHYVVTPDRFGPEWMLQIKYIPFVSTHFLN